MDGQPTLRSEIRRATRLFDKAGMETAELDARILVLAASGHTREDFIKEPDASLRNEVVNTIKGYVRRRLDREPVSRILGEREFWGLDFQISPAVLDPRPDTETMVETALSIVSADRGGRQPARILDLGTGSGCILLSLLSELPDSWGVGVDISAEALAIARKNAVRHGLMERCAFLCTNWGDGLEGQFDMVLSNPPYIRSGEIMSLGEEVRNHDPIRALDGGESGLDSYRQVIAASLRLTKADSWILIEAGYDQAEEIIHVFTNEQELRGKLHVELHCDLGGVNRVVAIKRHAGA